MRFATYTRVLSATSTDAPDLIGLKAELRITTGGWMPDRHVTPPRAADRYGRRRVRCRPAAARPSAISPPPATNGSSGSPPCDTSPVPVFGNAGVAVVPCCTVGCTGLG